MANDEHVRMLVNSTAEEWNAWREAYPYMTIDVSGEPVGILRCNNGLITKGGRADFRRFDFDGVDLTRTLFLKSDLSSAKLRNAIHSQVILIGAKLHEADLSGSEFYKSYFNVADLTSAILKNASFRKSYMKGVNLTGASLDNTDFATSDLTAAILPDCNLSRVKLSNADLTCASLQHSDIMFDRSVDERNRCLVDEGLAESLNDARAKVTDVQDKIRDRIPLDEVDLEIVKGFVTVHLPDDLNIDDVSSVPDIFGPIGDVVERYKTNFGARRFRVYYRGHGCVRWPMTNSLDRGGLGRYEPELLNELTLVEPEEFRFGTSILDQLTLARHHSLPARLVDVTRNPLVALYFAVNEVDPCEDDDDHKTCARDGAVHVLVTPTEMVKPYDSDSVSVLAAMSRLDPIEQEVALTYCPDRKSPDDVECTIDHQDHVRPNYLDVMLRLSRFVARDKPYFRNEIDPRDFFRVLVVEPRRAFTRVRAQSGAFLLSGHHTRFEAEEVKKNGPKIPIYDHYTIRVPRDGKRKILKQLEYAQIDEVTMLPGLEPVARSISERYGSSGK